MRRLTRRGFLKAGAAAAAGVGLVSVRAPGEIPPGERPKRAEGVDVLNPRGRVPLSFFIDDSTCLVNLGHFCMPQFAEAWPQQAIYKKPWKTWPREIPDAFVREFGEWCAEHGIRGKYSVVPYPACVGWLDRELPGWSRSELRESLRLVRELMAPRWDIHPEMITHTRVIDVSSGRPLEEVSSATMENSYPQSRKSVDELATYIAYALRILKNCDLPCEGITTPGGFGNLVKSELSLAVGEAVRDVYGAEIPHYFKYVADGPESTEPKLEHVSGLDRGRPSLTVNIPAGTGDWFGGWDGDEKPNGDRYATADASGGRLVELIERGEPAILLCHWPGMYTQGTKEGFAHFQRVALALERRYRDRTLWMKSSEIARYWAAKELTAMAREGARLSLSAPFATPDFTLRIRNVATFPPRLERGGTAVPLEEVRSARDLSSGRWLRENSGAIVCFDLPKGESALLI